MRGTGLRRYRGNQKLSIQGSNGGDGSHIEDSLIRSREEGGSASGRKKHRKEEEREM